MKRAGLVFLLALAFALGAAEKVKYAFLSSTLLPVKDIAFRSGFRNVTVFTAAFKDRFGLPPREYRERKSGMP